MLLAVHWSVTEKMVKCVLLEGDCLKEEPCLFLGIETNCLWHLSRYFSDIPLVYIVRVLFTYGLQGQWANLDKTWHVNSFHLKSTSAVDSVCTLSSFSFIYIYIYICLCVRLCVCVRVHFCAKLSLVRGQIWDDKHCGISFTIWNTYSALKISIWNITFILVWTFIKY